MTIAQARKKLESLGFRMVVRWGSQKAESFPQTFIGQNHFIPKFRDVFIGHVPSGWYITSHIHGNMIKYKQTEEERVTICNIFGHGKTLAKAMKDFVSNFKTKTYNIS